VDPLTTAVRDSASFKDPSGFVFSRDGEIFRYVAPIYREHFELASGSGLQEHLIRSRLLIEHEDVTGIANEPGAFKTLKLRRLPFVSYPYEWCFSELKDAALLTLQIQKIAMEYGASLKDCSAFNVQFLNGKPILIDTLSFEKYEEEPWVAYRQFCEQFLAPLALMSYRDIRLGKLLEANIEGIPVDLAAALLPARAAWNVGLFTHLRLHSYFQARSGSAEGVTRAKLARKNLMAILDNLESTIRSLKYETKKSTWSDYKDERSYGASSLQHKKQVVDQLIGRLSPRMVWDIGANTGEFACPIAEKGIHTVALDFDPVCVEIDYVSNVRNRAVPLLPLCVDIASPSPSLGWAHRERKSLAERGPADVALALALIHHLAITRNVPLLHIAEFFAKIADALIVEFVPPDDGQVKRLLSTKKGSWHEYGEPQFLEAFDRYFVLERREQIMESGRLLTLFRKRK